MIRGYIHPYEAVWAKLIYKKDPRGLRFDNHNNAYTKDIGEELLLIPKSDIADYFRPLEAPILKNLSGIWKNIYDCLWREVRVPQEDIGVFGSALLGFPIMRDVDFIIYGRANCVLVKNNMDRIKKYLGYGGISDDHIKYQSAKFNLWHDPQNTNFSKTLKNKWPTMQIRPGISNTIMFGYKEEEIGDWLEAGGWRQRGRRNKQKRSGFG